VPETIPHWLRDPETDLEKRFADFHELNPHVYERLERMALSAIRRGVKRIGMKQLFEVLRWNSALRTAGEAWKLNNSYTSLYARLLIHHHPEMEAVIETRRSQVDGEEKEAA